MRCKPFLTAEIGGVEMRGQEKMLFLTWRITQDKWDSFRLAHTYFVIQPFPDIQILMSNMSAKTAWVLSEYLLYCILCEPSLVVVHTQGT